MSNPELNPSPLKILFLLAGTLAVALGVVGIFIPVLPTTPFLLLAAYFYLRSSPRLHAWLTTNRWFGAYIRNYRAGLGIPLPQKVLTLVLLWASIAYTAGFIVQPWWGKLLLIGIAGGVTWHLLRIKTYTSPAAPPVTAVVHEDLPPDVA